VKFFVFRCLVTITVLSYYVLVKQDFAQKKILQWNMAASPALLVFHLIPVGLATRAQDFAQINFAREYGRIPITVGRVGTIGW